MLIFLGKIIDERKKTSFKCLLISPIGQEVEDQIIFWFELILAGGREHGD